MRRLVCLTSVVVLPVGLLHAILSLNAAMASSSSAQWRSRPTELLDQARDLTLSLYGSAGSPAEGWFPEQVESTTKQSSSDMGGGTDALPTWMNSSNLVFNPEAKALLTQWVPTKPGRVTLHFTFGSVVMMDFVQNWVHFVRRAGLEPMLIGAADASLLARCSAEHLAATGVRPELDVWTYAKRQPQQQQQQVFDLKSDWKYYRHHKSSFLEMGLVKVAFLWELLTAGYNVLISDLDVVWLTPHWRRWMAYGDPNQPPLREAALSALADVLVSTDEINHRADSQQGGWGFHSELNTGVLYFRATPGALGVVQAWRRAMMHVRSAEFMNDQNVFNQVIGGAGLVRLSRSFRSGEWAAALKASGVHDPADVDAALGGRSDATRDVAISNGVVAPCLPEERCKEVHFSLGTLPARGFTNGHLWFNQYVQRMPGHELPQNEPVTVHFTFQFGDTQEYPHGKRQRAREAALWSVDPPEYFTEGVFVRLVGDLYTAEQQAAVFAKFPEWSPQRHMHMDAIQRAAVRDVLALATAVGGIMIMPKLHCFCDRYWNFLTSCRFPIGPRDMPIPFWCPQDALFDLVRWNTKKVRFREATFLDNEHVPPVLKENVVRVRVGSKSEGGGEAGGESDGESGGPAPTVHVKAGTPMDEVGRLVRAAHPGVRLVLIGVDDIKRLCKWLGSARANKDFNNLARYVLTDSSRYCPNEDHRASGAWDWRNPFTAYNCTWGFHYPTVYPEAFPCGDADGGSRVVERTNSTTCPRQMLCGWNTVPSGAEVGKLTFCNLEGYGGMCAHDGSGRCKGAVDHMLHQMGGRCPYPPGDKPGGGPGLDAHGHWIGTSSATSSAA